MCCIPFACSYSILMKGTKNDKFVLCSFCTDVLVYFRGPFLRSFSEGSGEVTIELVMEGESDTAVTVTVRSREGSATGELEHLTPHVHKGFAFHTGSYIAAGSSFVVVQYSEFEVLMR